MKKDANQPLADLSTDKQTLPPASPGRRRFLGKAGGLTAATLAASAIGLEPFIPSKRAEALAGDGRFLFAEPRRKQALKVRRDAAAAQAALPLPPEMVNGDETALPTRIGSYAKGLPHNGLGQVDPLAYNLLLNACQTGRPADFEAVPLGGTARQINPQAGLVYQLEGADSHHHFLITPPAFSSAWEASEMVEVYWQALTRDIHFSDYATNPTIAQAAADLSNMSDFRGPKTSGKVTPSTLFRGETAGDLTGPYISQLLWKDVPSGPHTIVQRYRVPVAGDDFMRSYGEWLNIQRGIAPSEAITFDANTRYLRNGRDLSEYLHRDYSYQAFLYAALILLSLGAAALDDNNPYKSYTKQAGFTTFGGPDILDMMAKAGNAGLKAAWYPKWFVHRRVRPEAFAGHVHNHKIGAVNYPIHSEVLNSQALAQVFSSTGTYLLPMAYPEGSPTHPAYPSGHAAIGGACVTILKAFFKESMVIPNPVEANADGTALIAYTGGPLTIGGELNKLAANIGIGRDTAGVHWRTDGVEGLRLGEAVAISMLRDYRNCYNEDFAGFSLTKFDGTTIGI
jgi:membrane-associated phospholipid phosphatase